MGKVLNSIILLLVVALLIFTSLPLGQKVTEKYASLDYVYRIVYLFGPFILFILFLGIFLRQTQKIDLEQAILDRLKRNNINEASINCYVHGQEDIYSSITKIEVTPIPFIVGLTADELFIIKYFGISSEGETKYAYNFHQIKNVYIKQMRFGLGYYIHFEAADGKKFEFSFPSKSRAVKKQKENLQKLLNFFRNYSKQKI